MKKVLSILLCVLMLAGVMAMAVSAKSIQNIFIEIDEPIPGENPSFYPYISEPESGIVAQEDFNSSNFIHGVRWYDQTAGVYLNEDSTFIEGHSYLCSIWVQIEDYDDDIDSNLNAYIIGASNSDVDSASSNQALIVGTFVCEKGQIHFATLNLDVAPKYCELVYSNEYLTMGLASLDRSYNSNGFVNGVKWFANGVVVKKGERFKPNTNYTLQAKFKSGSNYEFAPDVEPALYYPDIEDEVRIGAVISYDSKSIIAEYTVCNTGHPAKGLYTSSDGAKFYFTSEGKMYVKRLASVNGKKYYFGADGVAYTKRLISVDGKKYYMGKDGVAYTSKLISVSGKKYYMGKDGVAYTSKLISVSGKKYYMGKDGVAYKSKLISVSGKKYYIGKDCIAYKSKFASLSGKKYYFGSDCVMYKSKTFSVSGVKWRADSNGVCKKV